MDNDKLREKAEEMLQKKWEKLSDRLFALNIMFGAFFGATYMFSDIVKDLSFLYAMSVVNVMLLVVYEVIQIEVYSKVANNEHTTKKGPISTIQWISLILYFIVMTSIIQGIATINLIYSNFHISE